MRIGESPSTFYVQADYFGPAIEWLLVAVIAFAPLTFGIVDAWSEEILIALAAALSLCFLLRIRMTRRPPASWTSAYVPVAAFVLVAVLQLVPLPASWVGVLSPNTAALKTQLLSDVPGAQQVLSRMTISFYPCATRHDLRLLLAVAAIFVIVFNVYRRPSQIVRVLGVIAAVGGVVVVLALVQNVAGNGKIYWLVPTPQGTARSGPFVNHSHYAQYVSLSVGAALALVFVKLHEVFAWRRTVPATVAEYLGSRHARIVWAALVLAVLGAATVFLSMSRGGMISMLIAAALTTLILSVRYPLKGPGWIMVLFALGAFVCVLYIGFDAVYDRLATLGDLQASSGGRWQILKDVASAWTQFPLLGTGLGTHEVVYPMFDRSMVPALATHAENEYAQAAEETGLVGLIALAVFGIIVWSGYTRAGRVSVPVHSAAYGLGFGLIAILVHSLSDFGQHVPANAILSAIFCALLIRLAHGVEEGRSVPETVPAAGAGRHGAWVAAFAVLCLTWGWALVGADASRAGESHWKKVLEAERDLTARDWQGGDAEYAYLIGHGIKAADCQPDNVKYKYWLNVYRWHALSHTLDPNVGDITAAPEVIAFAEKIAEELNSARILCPTYGATWHILGQLERAVLGRAEEGARHIRMGRRLAPCDATVCLVAGMLSAEEGDAEAAFAEWRRAVQLDEDSYREVALLCIQVLRQPERALELVGDSVSRLIWLAEALADAQASPELVQKVEERVSALLTQKCGEPQAPADAFVSLAASCRRQGHREEAIKLYRRALALDFGRFDWHYHLATLLAENGRTAEAVQEAKTCLRLRPQYAAAKKLLAELSVRTEGPEEWPESP